MALTISNSPHKGTVHPSLGAHQAAGEARYGSLYTGVVRQIHPGKKSYDVRLDKPAVNVYNAIYAGPFFSSLLGVQTHFVPPPGTRVLLVYGNPSVIVATLPSSAPDTSGGKSRTLTHEEVPDASPTGNKDAAFVNHSGPNSGADFLAGELEIGNQMGVALQILLTMSKLQAGDRAKVEVHLVDELVRFVSGKHIHHSAFGDHEISDTGGGPTCITHGTSKTHEAWGQLTPGDPKAKVDAGRVAPDGVAETLRARMSSYIGYLGDFVHWIVADPEEAIGSIMQSRAGKFDAHVNSDGSLLVRTVSEIAFEKVVRIPVPIQKKSLDDPDGNTREEIDQAVLQGGLNLDQLLKRWDYNEDRMHYLPYVLRHYARYLAQLHSYARVLSQDKDFEIPSEADSPEPSWNNGESDVERANSGAMDYYEAYACIRILRDGSVVSMDAAGNAWVMSKNGVQASSILDYSIEAARDVKIAAGRNVLVTGRRHVEINAIVGGLKLKSRTLWHALCERGSMWLKSDAPDPSDPQFSSKRYKSSDKLHPDDPDAEILDAAILMDAELGSSVIQSGRRVLVESTGEHLGDGEESDEDNDRGAVVLQSKKQDVLVHAARNSFISALGTSDTTGRVGLRGARHVVLLALDSVLVKARELFDVNQQVTLRKGVLHTRQFMADKITGIGGIHGPELGPEVAQGSKGVPNHHNHIRKIEGGEETELAEKDEVEPAAELMGRPIQPVKAFSNRAPSWDYFPKSEYMSGGGGSDDLPWRSLSQERLEDDESGAYEDYEVWNWSDNALSSAGARTGKKHKHPWYGENPRTLQVQNTEPLLSELSSTPPADLNEEPEVRPMPKKFLYKPD